jgi:hypothetical protein
METAVEPLSRHRHHDADPLRVLILSAAESAEMTPSSMAALRSARSGSARNASVGTRLFRPAENASPAVGPAASIGVPPELFRVLPSRGGRRRRWMG